MHERGDDGQLAFHAQGHAFELARGVQVELLEQVLGLAHVGDAPEFGHELDELGAREPLGEGDLAGKIAELPLDHGGLLPAVHAVDRRRALLGLGEAHDVPDGGGLARAVRPQEPEHLALVDAEGDVESAPAETVVLCQVVDLE